MRPLLILCLLLATPAHAQYLTPQDAGAAIEAQFSSMWVPMRTCERNWQADAGDGLTHPNWVGTPEQVGEFAQCVYRGDLASLAVISRDDVSLPEVIPPNLDDDPTDRPGMTCRVIFKPCLADVDTLPRGFGWEADVYEVPTNHAGYPGAYGGWGFDIELCFAWDEDKDDVGDEKWCKTQGDGLDPEDNNTTWAEEVDLEPIV